MKSRSLSWLFDRHSSQARNIKKRLLVSWLAPKKGAIFCLIYFFKSFCIYYIPHNYVIPQAMPHAIPQTHSSFYPHRSKTSQSPLTKGCPKSLQMTIPLAKRRLFIRKLSMTAGTTTNLQSQFLQHSLRTLEEGTAIETSFGTTPLSAETWPPTLDDPS